MNAALLLPPRSPLDRFLLFGTGSLLALIVLSFAGCAGKAPINVATAVAEAAPPDLSGVLRLAGGNYSRAHGCPLGDRLMLTAAHVVLTSREFSREGNYDDPPMFFTWATRDDMSTGRTGRVQPDRYQDLAWVETITGPFPRTYTIATEAPEPGAKLYFAAFDFRSRRNALAERRIEATLIRIAQGQLVYKIDEGVPGSSGSCILDQAGHVVGINGASMETADGAAVGLGVSIVGLQVPVIPEAEAQ